MIGDRSETGNDIPEMEMEGLKGNDTSEESDIEVTASSGKTLKKARHFDFDAMFIETMEKASERFVGKDDFSSSSVKAVIDEDKSAKLGLSEGGCVKIGSTHIDDEENEFDVPIPKGFSMSNVESFGGTDDTEDDDDEYDELGDGMLIVDLIPTAAEAVLQHGKKPVSALAVDHQGTRFASGGFNYAVNLFEFQKMDQSLRPSRELYPCESHVINSLAFNSNGEYLLVGSGHAQIRILDRNGKQRAETVRGDQYLIDLSNTKGHTGTVNCCCWHPLTKTEFMSCADDGTVRIWSMDDYKEITHCLNKQRKVIKPKTATGKRSIPVTCAYSRDGKLVAAGCSDGSIQIWKHGSFYVNTAYLNRTAHSGPVSCLQFSPNSQNILSRSLDGTLKLWDLSRFKEPIHEVKDLPNDFSCTDCGFSPRGEIVFTAASMTSIDEDEHGSLLFFDSSNFELVYKIKYPKASCTKVIWHPKINQIFVALSDGSLRLYYDPANSSRGALECVRRPIRRARQQEVVKEEMIISPLTLEMFQPRGEEGEEREVTAWRLKKYLRMLDNKLRPDFRKPADMPMSGPSTGGRVARSGSTLHSYIAQQVGTKRNHEFLADTDVRSSILRHAEEAEKNPYYVAKAYLKNQPVTIFQDVSDAVDEGESGVEPVYKVSKKN